MSRAIAACRAAGLHYEPNHKHPRLVDKRTGKYVSFSATPSCQHAYKHLLRDVRKYLNIQVIL